jgi:ABC-type nitrate/sulfonate/bicarbonate transport system permease component
MTASFDPVALARTRRGRGALGLVGVVVALTIWQVLPTAGLVPGEHIPGAATVVVVLAGMLGTADFWVAVGATAAGAGVGLLLATVAGLALGVLMGSSPWADYALRPSVEFLRPVPGVALIPVAILLFGPSLASDVSLVAFGCVWVLLVQTLYGVGAVDPATVDSARSYGLTRSQRVWWVQLPSALPYVATGLRIASSIALIIAVTAELIGANTGLGRSIMLTQTGGQTAQMYALILATGVLGIGVHVAFSALERRFLHWHQSQRVGVAS